MPADNAAQKAAQRAAQRAAQKAAEQAQAHAAATAPPVIIKAANGDNILWYDRPGAAAYAQAWIRAFAMGAVFLAFAGALASVAAKGNMPGQIYLIVAGLGVIGGAYALAPLYGYVIARYFMVYLLTDMRIVIVQMFPAFKETKVTYGQIAKLTRQDTGLNQGTLFISLAGKENKKNLLKPHLGLYGIKRVSQVETVINGQIKTVNLEG